MNKWDTVEVLDPSFFASVTNATWDTDNDLVIPLNTTALFVFKEPVRSYIEFQIILESIGGDIFPGIKLLYDIADTTKNITWLDSAGTGDATPNIFPYVGDIEGFQLTTPQRSWNLL
jgi:hypothetical protein